MACITKRGNRYVLDFYDCQGVRQRQTLPKDTTKGAAKDKLREIEDQVAKGVYIPDKKIPIFDDVVKDFLEYKKLNLRESTWSVYEGHTRNHFNDFEGLKINRITTATVEKFIAKKQQNGIHLLTLRKILITLGQIMAYAVRHKYIDYNPVRDAERPRGRGGEQESKIMVLAPAEINKFLNAVPKLKYKTLFKLAITSGARQGELLGLKWSDIDWQKNQIHIQRTFNTGRWYDVKSKTSNRRIDLGPSMMMDLKRWKLACMPNKFDLVFPNRNGNPISKNDLLKRYFRTAIKKAGLPPTRFHHLRHTFASLLIEQGENIKYIQSQLGHSSPTVTLDVYAHLMKPVNQESATKLENTLFNSTGHKLVTI
jgi:integrase